MKNVLLIVLLLPLLIQFCTKDSKAPEGEGNQLKITTKAVTDIQSNIATSGGDITSDGGEQITERGICWSKTTEPNTSSSVAKSGNGTGQFSSQMTGLTPNQQYYVRAYAINNLGTVYGNEISFKTLSSLPSVSNVTISSITLTSASASSSITSDGGAALTQKGVCWSTSPNPTIANSKTSNGTAIGSFTASLTGLTSNTTYYVRAYATNNRGTSYGSQTNFTTLAPQLPTITTNFPSSITSSTAVLGGNVTSDGGASVTQRGVCWSTAPSPTITSNQMSNGSGVGAYSSIISGLSPNTNYYVRAYAINSAGTVYGNQQTFKTAIQLPTVSTTAVSSVSTNSASISGTVNSDGGSSVTERGICWSSSTLSPTISNSKAISGSGVGNFSASISTLSSNTTYYTRAYAINAAGTSYGNVLEFKTAISAPSLTYPSHGSQIGCCNVYFQWTNISGATQYEIQISKSTSFTGTVYTLYECGQASSPRTTGVSIGTTSTNSMCINPGGSSNNGIWYWRVRAKNSSNVGNWSNIYYYNYVF